MCSSIYEHLRTPRTCSLEPGFGFAPKEPKLAATSSPLANRIRRSARSDFFPDVRNNQCFPLDMFQRTWSDEHALGVRNKEHVPTNQFWVTVDRMKVNVYTWIYEWELKRQIHTYIYIERESLACVHIYIYIYVYIYKYICMYIYIHIWGMCYKYVFIYL